MAEGSHARPWHARDALNAAHKLEEASQMVIRLNFDLETMLDKGAIDDPEFENVLRLLVRMRRYQRRFRGQRDRAMRALVQKRPPPPAARV